MKKTISGIRGIFGQDFDLRDALEFCSRFSALAGPSCAVGMDTRESGRMVLETAKAALMGSGVDVYDFGVVPTPVIFRESRRYGSGVIVTSSHNPMDWNGLKFTVSGRGINQDELSTILDGPHTPGTETGSDMPASTSYVEDAVKIIGSISGSPSIVVDLGGGAARHFAPRILKGLGCTVRTINDTPQECTRTVDPTADGLEELASMTMGGTGFAFDPDGDRLVVVDNGKKQSPDMTLGLGIAKSIMLGCKKFVLSVDSSVAIEEFAAQRGCSIHRSRVGEANVMDMMQRTGADAGGEGSSGGFVLPEFNYCRDGMLTSGLIASMLGDPAYNEVQNHMQGYHQVRTKIAAAGALHDMIIEKVRQELSGEFSETDMTDGVKGIIDEKSWILVRKSNTEDVIRVSVESDSPDRCMERIKNVTRLVNQCHEQAR